MSSNPAECAIKNPSLVEGFFMACIRPVRTHNINKEVEFETEEIAWQSVARRGILDCFSFVFRLLRFFLDQFFIKNTPFASFISFKYAVFKPALL